MILGVLRCSGTRFVSVWGTLGLVGFLSCATGIFEFLRGFPGFWSAFGYVLGSMGCWYFGFGVWNFGLFAGCGVVVCVDVGCVLRL